MFRLIKKLLDIRREEFKLKIDKISLSCYDDKRFILDDGIHTLAYFHINIAEKIKKDHDNRNLL